MDSTAHSHFDDIAPDLDCRTCRQVLAVIPVETLEEMRDLLLLMIADGTPVAPGAVERIRRELAARQA